MDIGAFPYACLPTQIQGLSESFSFFSSSLRNRKMRFPFQSGPWPLDMTWAGSCEGWSVLRYHCWSVADWLTGWLADWPRSINRLRRQRSMFVWHFSSTFVVRARIISIPNPERPRRFSSRLATHFPHTHSRTNLISAVSRRHSKLLFVTLLSPSSQVSLTSFQGVSDSHYLFR